MTLKSKLRNLANTALAPLGVELTRRKIGATSFGNQYYIAAQHTIDAAAREGLQLHAYLEKKSNLETSAQQVVAGMTAAGVFQQPLPRICEIGAGTGIYTDKVLQATACKHYESYEIAEDWAAYLVKTYGVITMPTDGKSLASTPDRSIDLMQSHGVFVYLNFLNANRYWREMFRVAAPGSWVVFDFFTEACMQPADIESWLASGARYPVLLPRQYVVDIFERAGFELVSSFFAPTGAARSEYLILRKLSQFGLRAAPQMAPVMDA